MDERERKARLASNTLLLYGFFLAACGFAGFALAGFEAKARTALIVGSASGGVAALCGLGARASTERARGIAVHLGLVTAAVMIGLLGWRASLAYAVPEKQYLAHLLSVMCAGSAATLAFLVANKPKPKPKPKVAE